MKEKDTERSIESQTWKQRNKQQIEGERQIDRQGGNKHRNKEIIKMKLHKKESKGYDMVTLDYCLR